MLVQFTFLLVGVLAIAFATPIPWVSVASDSSGQFLVAAASNGTASPFYPLYKSDDYGENWSPLPNSPLIAWNAIYSDRSGKIIVAGSLCTSYSTTCDPVYVSHDRGDTWTTAQGLPAYHSIHTFTGDESGLLLGTTLMVYIKNGPSYPTNYFSKDGGLTWKYVSIPSPQYDSNSNYGVASDFSGKHLCAVNEQGYTSFSDDGGSYWRVVKNNWSYGHWSNFAYDSTGTHLYLVASNLFYITSNKGSSFHRISEDDWYFYPSLAVDDLGETAYVVSGSGGGRIGRYTKTLDKFEYVTKGPYNAVAVNGKGDRVVATMVSDSASSIWTSADGGVTWVSHDTSSFK